MEKTKTTLKSVLSVIGNALLWIFLIFSMLITVMVFSAQNSPDGIPSVFGKSLLTVATDSMEPVFNVGDLIIMEKVDPADVPSLPVGTVITYRSPIDLNGDGMTGDINTHRIMEVDAEQECFLTKGDHNQIADYEGSNAYTVDYHAVVGTYTGLRLPGVGRFLAFLRSSLGFFLCIVLPLILFFLYELYNFISVLVTEKAKKAAGEVSKEDEEEIKRRAIAEYLARQAAEKAEKKASDEAELGLDDDTEA